MINRVRELPLTKINDLIEWDYCGSSYSLYVKHFVDDEGHKGATMIFEDLTHDKVTEMIIPTRKFSAFLQAVNGSDGQYRGLF